MIPRNDTDSGKRPNGGRGPNVIEYSEEIGNSTLPNHMMSTIVVELESNMVIEWEVIGGGRVAQITPHMHEAALKNINSNTNGTYKIEHAPPRQGTEDHSQPSNHKRKLKHWGSIGQINGLDGSASCFKSKYYYLDSLAASCIVEACGAMAQASAAGRLANNAWWVWQNSPHAQDPNKQTQDMITFSTKSWGSPKQPFTTQVCERAYNLITSSVCQDKDKANQSHGGAVDVGELDKGSWVFEVDPNDQDYKVNQ